MSDSLIGTGNPIGRPSGLGNGKAAPGESDDDVLKLMRKRWAHIMSVDSENRESYIKNVRISSSNNQWDEEVKKRRGASRPALTFNLLNLVVKQIIGDYRQNKMTIKVLPSGGPTTEEKADILAGMIRDIERASNADESYTNALECSSRGNIGYWRILPEYEADDVFNQKLVIKPIKNPLTVGFDTEARLITRSDAGFAFISEKMPIVDFRREYPKAQEEGWDIIDNNADDMDDWGNDEYIRVAEYFVKEKKIERLVAFDSGATLVINDDSEIEALKQIGWNVQKERQAERTQIKWYKTTGTNILETRVFKTKYIPIIPVLGEEVNIEGKVCLRSAVYYAIDAQHSYNYERSTAVEYSALSAKAPWTVTNKMIEMWRKLWDDANTTPQPYLVYTPDPAAPQGPQRIEPPTPSAANMANSQVAALDVQRTTGVFNSQVGEQSNIESGIGLKEQQSQGMTSTFIFNDNLRTGIEHCGRILVDWIPEFYDTERTVRTINSEDDIEMQQINQKQENPLMAVTEVLNDITVGQYDVIVTAGKAFASRRAEAVDNMIKWAQAFPTQAPLVGDIVLKNMDVPGGEVASERIKRSLPPQVVNDPDSPEGQQAAQQVQQQQAQAQNMQMQLIQSKMQAEQGKNQASMAKAHAEETRASAEVVKAKADTIQTAIELHSTQAEHAIKMLDNDRMAQESASGIPQGSQPAGGGSSPSSPAASQGGMQLTLMRTPEDQARDGEMHQGLSAIAQHLAASHHANAEQQAQTHALLAHIAQGQQQLGQHLAAGHQAIAQHMHRANEIATAPTEAVRDKTGRITGSRKAV